jgi:hypothetical protein
MEQIEVSSTMEGLDDESSSVVGRGYVGVAPFEDQGWRRYLAAGHGVPVFMERRGLGS